jgi:hypothetical protein
MGNYFQVLNSIDVTGKSEKKNGLTYLSWAWAWAEVKKLHPNALYTIYENKDGWFYHTDGKTGWVKTGVTIEGVEHIEYLPIMDFRNKSIPTEAITSFDVNKAIQRSLTKAVARHGLGLFLYAGEDISDWLDTGEVRVSDVQVANDNEPIRKNTVELINVKLGELNAERLARFNSFYQTKFSFKKYEQLTEKEGRYLIALLSKEVQ